MTTRTVSIDISFAGTGRIVRGAGGHPFFGGIVAPDLTDKVTFWVDREELDEEGLWNPVLGEPTMSGGLQINIWADSEGYRELGRYFLALAELDSREDIGFHEHHEGLISADGRTRLHIICRKAPPTEWPSKPAADGGGAK